MRTHPWTLAVLVCAALVLGSAWAGSAQDVRTGVEQLAAQITKAAPEGKQFRIAVADFPDLQGVTSDLGRYIASRLTTRLAQSPKFSVIERQRLGQVLTELKFSMSDLVDPAKAKQLGRMVGVEAIVVGTVSDLGNQVDLDARVIEIETNRMLLATSTTIGKDQVVKDMLERGQQSPGAGAPTVAGQPGGTAGSAGVGGRPVAMGGFTFRPQSCRRMGGDLVCTVTFINTGNEEKAFTILGRNHSPESRLIDNRGNQWPVERIEIGRRKEIYVRERFLPQLPVNVHFFASDVPESATSVTIVIGIDQMRTSPVLRDVPIAR